jgi:hypothetical protein
MSRAKQLGLDARLATIRSLDRLGLAFFCAWAVGAIVVTIVRPGFLLEAATAGIAGALLWSAVREARPTRPVLALVAGCALVPLLNTWPARVYHAAWESRVILLAASLSLSSLVAGALLVLVRRQLRPRWSLVACAAGLALAAAAVSTAFADDSVAAAAGAWSAIVVPVAFAVVVATVVRSKADARLVLTALLAGALVPATAGIGAYVLGFGVPWTPADLVEAKIALFRTQLFQEITFGNVGHLADFALLLLPAALLLPFDRGAPVPSRIIASVAAAELTLCLLLVLSRGALTIAAAILAVAGAVAMLRRSPAAIAPLAVSLLFVAVLLSPSVRGTLTPEVGGVSVVDPSAVERVDAVEAGLEIARDALPEGVGSSRYLAYDPVHTAPHSLWIEVLAELGVLGLAALALVAAAVASAAWWLLRRPRLGSGELVVGSAVAGAAAFLGHGLAAGAPLAVGRVNVWAIMLAVLVMLAAGAARSDDA